MNLLANPFMKSKINQNMKIINQVMEMNDLQKEAQEEQTEAYRCTECGYDNAPGMKFCQECGAKLHGHAPAICKKCGAKNKTGANFCGECGEAL